MSGQSAGTVAITGAGSGIGLAAALHYAGHGWRVGLIGRGEPALLAAREQVERAGGTGFVAPADVTDRPALDAAATAIEAALGPIDVWINNAGIGYYGKFTDVPEEGFRRVIEVNLHGTVNGTRIALDRMRPRNRGTIVQVLSAIGDRGVPLQTAYSTTKWGLRGFTEALRVELLHERSGVYVTMVHPPSVNTPFYSHAASVMQGAVPRPPPPVYQPEILGEALYLAGTRKRREWRVGEQAVAISIANKVAPSLLDGMAAVVGFAAQRSTRKDVAEARDPSTFEPAKRVKGTHGLFDNEAVPVSPLWWLNKQPTPVRIGASLLALGALGLVLRRR